MQSPFRYLTPTELETVARARDALETAMHRAMSDAIDKYRPRIMVEKLKAACQLERIIDAIDRHRADNHTN